MTDDANIITQLGLEGHDSELFSFLDPSYVEVIQAHPAAHIPLWTFGHAHNDALTWSCFWNGPGCMAWTQAPMVQRASSDRFVSYRGYITDDELLQVEALVLVRLVWGSSLTCLLNDRKWMQHRSDPQLRRLSYIRRYREFQPDPQEWYRMKNSYFRWVMKALDRVECVSQRDHRYE